jgi:hypothetical protein
MHLQLDLHHAFPEQLYIYVITCSEAQEQRQCDGAEEKNEEASERHGRSPGSTESERGKQSKTRRTKRVRNLHKSKVNNIARR